MVYYQHFTGISNQRAINIATEQNAVLLGIEETTGTLEAGKSADLIVLAENPLEDLLALEHVIHVVHRGHLIENPTYKKLEVLEEQKGSRYFDKQILSSRESD